ncbi:hypothetical protein CN585_18280, partial [Bacillus toyonensis]
RSIMFYFVMIYGNSKQTYYQIQKEPPSFQMSKVNRRRKYTVSQKIPNPQLNSTIPLGETILVICVNHMKKVGVCEKVFSNFLPT